jgi:hypothetical protein
LFRILVVLASVILVSAVVLAPPVRAQSSPSPAATGTPTASRSTTPTAPLASPTPPLAGTPWPAPTNLRVTTQSRIVDEDGRPLPPERQEHTDILTWDHRPDFRGEYEIEVSLVPFAGGSPTVLETYIRVPASRGNGTIGRVSQYPEWLANQRCYRIRATSPSGTGGIEAGPFSPSACTVKPPSSGAPSAPDAGTGNSPGPRFRWFFRLTVRWPSTWFGLKTRSRCRRTARS